MIYYWSPDYNTPVGGVKILYHDVDVLNDSGIAAAVLHRKRGFRCTWFENATRVAYMGRTRLTAEDYLVIPEIYGSLYAHPEQRPKAARIFKKLFASEAVKVVFNQNVYNTFGGLSMDVHERRVLYTDPGVKAVMVVSDDNRAYLRLAFPTLPVLRIHNAINPQLFGFQAEKKPQICFMPRKNADHALQVINILKFAGDLEGISVAPIEGLSEQQTARIMQDSLIFLSFGYPEGFSLPPAEAMSCGCIVVGYHGMGGREYFKPEFCFPVEMGDIISFAQTIRTVLRMNRQEAETLKRMARTASDFIRQAYSLERERDDILQCWRFIMDQTGKRL